MSFTLIVARHADALARGPGMSDADRPLSDKGLRQADFLAAELATQFPALGELVSSPAVRTRQTAEPIADALGIDTRFDDRLFVDEPVSGHLELVEELIEETRAACVVGHNPNLSGLVDRLLSPEQLARPSSLRKGQAVVIGFPAGAVYGAGELMDVLRLDD